MNQENQSIWAVVPIKETHGAKQRLADFVPANLRPGLALAMMQDVLDALTAARGLAGIVVVTADKAAAEIARGYGARIFDDHARDGHTGVIAHAAARLVAEGCAGMMQIPGDIPLVTADEISRVLSLHQTAPSFTIVPSRDNFGSNAIVVSPPNAVPLTFGDDSFYPHLSAARRHGIEPLVVRMPGIGHDIDHPEDIKAFARFRSATRAQDFLDRNGFDCCEEDRARNELKRTPLAT